MKISRNTLIRTNSFNDLKVGDLLYEYEDRNEDDIEIIVVILKIHKDKFDYACLYNLFNRGVIYKKHYFEKFIRFFRILPRNKK